MTPEDPRHGETRGYYAHRRANQEACDACKRAVAKSENMRQLRLARGVTGRPSPIGMQRRLQALAAIGWSWAAIGRELGRKDSSVQKLATETRGYANALTISRVDDLYQRLSMTFPTAANAHQRGAITAARNMAARNGWLPPLAWEDIDDPDEVPDVRDKLRETDVDHAVVERVLSGEPKPRKLTNAECAEIVRRCDARGLTGNQINDMYGIRPERYRKVGDAA